MNSTLSVIEAGVDSIGGHLAPSREVFEAVKAKVASLGLRFHVREE